MADADADADEEQRQRREKLTNLLSLHANPKPLTPHDLVSSPESRREGLCPSSTIGGSATTTAAEEACLWTEVVTSLALEGCPYDEHLGIRFYRRDPLPWIRRACETANRNRPSSSARIKFVDHEFRTTGHIKVVAAPRGAEVKCIPGVITSSNCRDFRTDPKNRLGRIPHFVQKAGCSSIRGGPRWAWERGSSIENCSLFSCSPSIRSVDPRNVVQGKVGNCGFCSGFASVAAGFPDVVADAFGSEQEESEISLSEVGAVSVLLYPRGEPRYLLMDDYVLCCAKDSDGRDDDDDDGGGGGRNRTTSPSMRSVLDDDLWVRLLEKAFVKIQGSYASLDGHYKYNSLYRHPAQALQLLTGAPVALEAHYSKADADAVYDILAAATQDEYARVVHCRKRVDGLIPNHGYSLLWAGQGAEGVVRLACLRNPHGKGSYTGKYGFGRPVEELRRALLGEDMDETSLPKCFAACRKKGRIIWRHREGVRHPAFRSRDDDGIFFMEFGEFVECFPITTMVGPVRSRRADATTMKADDGDAPFGRDSNVPDCVHVVKKKNVVRILEIIDAASGLL